MNYKRYYSHGLEYFTKWRLLTEKQIKVLITLNPKHNNFWSIHKYYGDGSKGCPAIYIDLDGDNAKKDMEIVVERIKNMFSVKPFVWNSGSKGYHIVVGKEVRHPHCEKIAKFICEHLAHDLSTWDDSVYKRKSMWRIPNSWNPKGNKPKTLVLEGDSNPSSESFNIALIEATLAIERELATKSSRKCGKIEPWNGAVLPCIKALIDKLPPLGMRHNARVLIARYFESVGADIDEAMSLVLQNPEYKEREESVRQVFESIYNNGVQSYFGCYGESILQDRCSILCKFNKGW